MSNDNPIPELKRPPTRREITERRRAYPFVDQGSVYGFALKEHLIKPIIPRNQSSIFTLLALKSRLTYGITGGEGGHLFYFHPAFGVTHVGRLSDGPVAGGALVDLGDDRVLGGWWGEGGGGLFGHRTELESAQGMEQFHGAVAPMEPLALPQPGEGIWALAFDPATRTAFGLTRPGSLLFSLAVDSAELVPQVLARIEGAAPVLIRLADGRLLGAKAEGQLWTYTPGTGQLTALEAYAPCQAGKRYVAGVQSLLAAADGRVYGGTDVDGYLFRYDPQSGAVVNLGKPNRQSCIRALAEGHDGLIYGVIEEPKGMAHLFSFDPQGQGFVDLGIVGTNFPEYWFAHSLGSMSVGPFGEIFLGETDALSHVFIYYPPVRLCPVAPVAPA